jgi:hypothetical protein
MNDVFNQAHQFFIPDFVRYQVQHDAVIYRRVKFSDVALQEVFVPANELHASAAGGMNASARPAGVGIRNEHLVPNGDKNVHDGVVDDSVWVEWKDVNLAFFRLVNRLDAVLGRGEKAVPNRQPQAFRQLLPIVEESLYFSGFLFMLQGARAGEVEVFAGYEQFPKGFVGFHIFSPLPFPGMGESAMLE